jgi:hypothetical protein
MLLVNMLTKKERPLCHSLSIIDKFYISFPKPPEPSGENYERMNRAKKKWDETFFVKLKFEIEVALGIRIEEVDDVLIRMSRSGFYKQISYPNGERGDGTLTPLFYRIKELIQLQ